MKNIIPTLKYMWLTTKHKCFVFRAGLWSKASIWNLLIHDYTKYSLAEAPYYGRRFFGDGDKQDFKKAWLHHQNHNPHHWEYWIIRPENQALEMPEKYIREMVADWLGASRAYEGKYPDDLENYTWFQNNKDKIHLAENTRTKLFEILDETFERKNKGS